jgi:NADPH:quinone reductase
MNEVLIKVRAAGVNFAEIELIQGRYPARKPLPHVIGFEAAGVVVEVGSQVKGLKVGDKVTSDETLTMLWIQQPPAPVRLK